MSTHHDPSPGTRVALRRQQNFLKKMMRQLRKWSVRSMVCSAVITLGGLALLIPKELSYNARLSLFALFVATVLWVGTKIPPAYVAIGAVLWVVLAGGLSEQLLYSTLATDLIWLMIGTFIIGGAMQKTGLAGRFTMSLVRRATTVKGLFWMLTTALLPLTFFIPSTSGRAAVTIPLFQSFSRQSGDQKLNRAMALTIPVIILVSTIATLIGAGSHLIAVGMLEELTGQSIGFLQWMLWGLPFAIVASFLSCWVIMHLFLGKDLMNQDISEQIRMEDSGRRLSQDEEFTLFVLGLMIVLWLTGFLHGLDIAFVSMLGAVILTLPKYGVISWKEGLASVSWNLIFFVAAAIGLGQAIIDSGAIDFIKNQLFSLTDGLAPTNHFFILMLLASLTLSAHLYIPSHTTRAIVLVPVLIYLAGSMQLNPVAVLFIGTVGMNFCLTFPVSSKALLLYAELEEATFDPKDLMKLSAVLIALHFVLIIIFYYCYWRFSGLSL